MACLVVAGSVFWIATCSWYALHVAQASKRLCLLDRHWDAWFSPRGLDNLLVFQLLLIVLIASGKKDSEYYRKRNQNIETIIKIMRTLKGTLDMTII